MKPIFGAYDKSLRDGKYLLFVNPELQSVALRAYGLFIADATLHAQKELSQGVRWPALHGGCVVVDDKWACVYRFAEARDLSANPRPLNVVFLALMRLGDARAKDWRGVLTSPAFQDFAETFRNGSRIRPASCDHDQYLADWTTNAEAVNMLENHANPASMGLEGACAAIASTAPDRHANIVISNLTGAEQFWVHRVQAEKSNSGPADGEAGGRALPTELLGRPRGVELKGGRVPAAVDYSLAWRKLRRFCFVVGLPAAVVVTYLAWPNGQDPHFERGGWYELDPFVLSDGTHGYDLKPSSNRSFTAFRMISDPSKDPIVFESAVGERRMVPHQLIKIPTTPPRALPTTRGWQKRLPLDNGAQSGAGAPPLQPPEPASVEPTEPVAPDEQSPQSF